MQFVPSIFCFVFPEQQYQGVSSCCCVDKQCLLPASFAALAGLPQQRASRWEWGGAGCPRPWDVAMLGSSCTGGGGGGKNCTWIPVVFSGRRAVRCHGFIPESWSVCWDPSGTMEMEES